MYLGEDCIHYNIYLSVITRNNYRTILSKRCSFEDMMTALANHEGRRIDQLVPFIVLSAQTLDADALDLIESNHLATIVVE